MSNPETSAVERYLMSDEAMKSVAVVIAAVGTVESVARPTEDTLINAIPSGAWTRVQLTTRQPIGFYSAYFRPEGDRFIVTDLGEGVRALRMCPGCYLAAELIAERMPWPEGIDAQLVTGGLRAGLRCDGVLRSFKVTAADLPHVICSTMLAAYRVANLEIK